MEFKPKTFDLNELMNKLKEVDPGVESFIDKDDLVKAQQSGELNEKWLIVYIRKKAQDKVYVDIKDKSSKFVEDFFDKPESPLGDLVIQLGSYIHNSFSDLVRVDDLAERVVRKYYTELRDGNLESMKEGVDDSRKEFDINLETRFVACEEEIDRFEKLLTSNMEEIEDKSDEFESVVINTAKEFRELNKEITKEAQELGGDYTHDLVKSKIGELSMDNANLKDFLVSKSETIAAIVKVVRFFYKGIKEFKKIKEKSMLEMIKLVLDMPSTTESVKKLTGDFINDCSYFSDTSKSKLNRALDAISSPDKSICCYLTGKIAPDFDELSVITVEMRMRLKEKEMRMKRARESDIGKFCNGGGWGVFSHIGSLGFCTGYSAAYAYDALAFVDKRYFAKVLFGTTMFTALVPLGVKALLPPATPVSVFFFERILSGCALPELVNEIAALNLVDQKGDCKLLKCVIQWFVSQF